MKPKLAWILALVAATGSTGGGEDVERRVRCAEIAFSRAAEARDLERFLESIDDEARFVGASVLEGRDAVAAAWAPFFEDEGPRIRWRPRTVRVTADGRLAFTRGPYRVERPGGEVSFGTFNSVWRRGDDGVWRVLFDMGDPPGRELTEEERAPLDLPDDCPRRP